jgi:hypothetical protein
MVTTAEQKQNVTKLFTDYLGAKDKTGPEQAVLKAMADLGRANLDATRNEFAARVKKIQEILTPEQISAFKQ